MFRGVFLALALIFGTVSGIRAQEQMQDVVYLKNGSVIRGTVVEAIPDSTVRIQTNDGSVFVWKMGEVEKISREKNITSPPGKRSSFYKKKMNIRYPDPVTASLLAIFPGVISLQGVGQWYNKEIYKGIFFFGMGYLGGSLILTGGPYIETTKQAVGLTIWTCSLVTSAIDAYVSAKRIRSAKQKIGVSIIPMRRGGGLAFAYRF